ncbi:MAG: plasma-membrane proton-efflux P-type ATPase [Thermoprotei archaeon]
MQKKEYATNYDIDFQKLKYDDVLTLLKSNLNSGLSQAEVDERLKKYGFNEMPEKKVSPVIKFIKKFWGLTAWMLELTIILSWILQKYLDFYIIMALLFLNSILGFIQEEKASKAVEMLKRKLQINARVLRDGIWKTVTARELVPGDIVRIRAGDFIPADIKIVSGEIYVDQSALTGESIDVQKRINDIAYSGSIIKRGEATGIVILTGVRTYFGKTVQLIQTAKPRLHMEEVISKVVRVLLIIVVIFLGSAVVFSIIKGMRLLEILPLILILLVSAIPVALPAMFTISMAIGSVELVKRGVLVTRLSASEDAATMDILCVDKTGTITMNKLSIANVIPLDGFSDNDVIYYGALASQEANQDPIDLAFINSAKQKGLINNSFVQKLFIPFDPKTRRTEAVIQDGYKEFRVAKGSVNVIAQLCNVDANSLKELEIRMSNFAKKGYRVLAVAKSDDNVNFKLVGLAALYDTLRPDSKELIKELKELGISVKMLTGDSLPIAKEIANEVGLGNNITDISTLKITFKESESKAAEIAETSDGFAEIYPEDKYTIVKSLQARKHVVGMTGDGINDAPALKQAEVGIAVSSATDVAKSAASVVLTTEGLINIVDLVKVGRMIYQRIITWILNKIIKTFQIVVFLISAFFLTNGIYIVSAFDIVLLLFVIDFVTLSLSTDNVRWSKKPDTWNITNLVKIAIILGILVVIESIGLLYIGFNYFNLLSDMQSLHTFTFTILFYSGIFTIFVIRERSNFWKSKPSKPLFIAIVIDSIIVAVISTLGIPGLKPISLIELISVIIYLLVFSLIINDTIKVMLVKKFSIRW